MVSMSCGGRWLSMIAAALGALGTTILFHWSFAFASFPI
jgi:hypothetical protein